MLSNEQLVEMASRVRAVFDSPSEGRCATFEVAGNSQAWAQVMKGTLNAAYTLDSSPEKPLAEVLACLPDSGVDAWEKKSFVTVTFDAADPKDVAKAIDLLFVKLFALDGYSVQCRMEDM